MATGRLPRGQVGTLRYTVIGPRNPHGNGDCEADIVAAEVVLTPWGEAGGLRRRRLPPGPGTPREEVDRNQRERLMAAMVAAVEARGYDAATVADLVALSGVSRSDFYRHFSGKRDCFLATMEEIIAAALAVVGSRYRRQGSWEERGRDALATFFELLAGQPAAARLVLVHSYAAGPAAVELVDRAARDFEGLARQALEQMPARRGMPPLMVRAGIGGLREVIHSRLRRGAETELAELAEPLVEAVLAYRSPPRALRGLRRAEAANRDGNGDVAAGAPQPVAGARRQGGGGDPAQRIVAATTATIARRGYARTSVNAIVAAASISRSTFYEHFDDRDEALAAALDAGGARVLAAAAPAYRRARGWPEGVRGAIGAIFDFLAAEPDFARLGVVEILGAGEDALARRERTVARLTAFLGPGFERAPRATGIAGEQAVGSVLALVHERVRAGAGAGLPDLAPLATYIVLSPFLGAETACVVANGGSGARGGGRRQ